MKKLLFLSLFLCSLTGFAQTLSLPIDFESTTQTYTFNDFNGGGATVIPNPQSSGINTSAHVAQMVKSPGEVWGGSFMELSNPIDFVAARSFKIKVYAPRAGARLLLKVENLTDGAIYHQLEDTVTTANSWEELSFDMRYINLNKQYSKIVFIFDMDVMGDGSANFTFLFDDIQLVNEGPYLDQIDLPVTFDDATVDYGMTDFGGNYSSVVADPAGGANKVAMATKSLGAAGWAGTTIGRPVGLATAIPLNAANSKMNVRIYAPRAGITIRLKVEDAGDPTRSVETDAITTQAQAWETLEFDFNNEAMGTAVLNPAYNFNMASIFFHFGVEGINAGADTVYYFDDVKFGPSGVGIEELLEQGLVYYPNPVREVLALRADAPIGTIRLFDLMGKEVLQRQADSEYVNMDVSMLPAAIYWMQVEINGIRGSFKLVKAE